MASFHYSNANSGAGAGDFIDFNYSAVPYIQQVGFSSDTIDNFDDNDYDLDFDFSLMTADYNHQSAANCDYQRALSSKDQTAVNDHSHTALSCGAQMSTGYDYPVAVDYDLQTSTYYNSAAEFDFSTPVAGSDNFTNVDESTRSSFQYPETQGIEHSDAIVQPDAEPANEFSFDNSLACNPDLSILTPTQQQMYEDEDEQRAELEMNLLIQEIEQELATPLKQTVAEPVTAPKSPKGRRPVEKQTRVAKLGRQPRATRGQIDALVGQVSKKEARAKLVSRSMLARLPNDTMASKDFSTVEAAKARLERAGPGIRYERLKIHDDDYGYVNDDVIVFLSNRLFDALSAEPSAAPPQIPEEDKFRFDRVQADALSRVRKALDYHETREDARARCVLLVDAAFRLHARGIPVADLDRDRLEKGKLHASGFPVDVESTFYLRMHRILHTATTNKLVAVDIMNGSGIDALVRSPREYVHRKVLNFRGNDNRAKITEAGMGAAAVQSSPERLSTPGGGRVGGGRRRGCGEVIDLTEIPGAPKRTRT